MLFKVSHGKSKAEYYDKTKCKEKPITDKEAADLYACRSGSFVAFTVLLAVVAVAVVTPFAIVAAAGLFAAAAPIATAAAAFAPAIAGAAWSVAAAVTAKTLIFGVLALAGAASYFTYTTAKGTKVEVGVRKNMKMKNRQEVKYTNRYCNYEPIRDEKNARQDLRVDQRSRGKNGENSDYKKETERDEHGNSKETTNEFADEHEMLSLNQKSNELKKDSAKKESIDALEAELKNKNDELNAAESNLNSINESANQRTNEIDEMNKKISENETKKHARDVAPFHRHSQYRRYDEQNRYFRSGEDHNDCALCTRNVTSHESVRVFAF